MIINRLDSGDDFATLAMNYSEDTDTSGNGGDLGFTPESSLRNTDPATRDTVTKLKPGQYSPVIPVTNPASKQLFGFRIVKLVAKEPAGQRELGDPRVQQAGRTPLRRPRVAPFKAGPDPPGGPHSQREELFPLEGVANQDGGAEQPQFPQRNG